MKTLVDHLSKYAEYHQDSRNIVTHFIGIPMIVLAVTTLLSRPGFNVAHFVVTPAVLLALLSCLFYLRLDLAFGLSMTVLLTGAVWAGRCLAALSTPAWLVAGIGLFVIGWAIQFVGHHYEGRKPAFLDDLTGLIIGPLFILVEACFAFGLRRNVQAQIVERVQATARHSGAPVTIRSSLR